MIGGHRRLLIMWIISLLFVLLWLSHMPVINLIKDRQQNIKKVNLPTKSAEIVSGDTFTKPFIYLTQTEKCLPLNLVKSIGINNTCNCDVMVLSYQAECTEISLVNETYLFEPQSTWNSGRNTLYFAAVNRTPGYLYYIFLDDDVEFIFNEFTPPDVQTKLPLQSFQQWLLDYEPVVGYVDFHHYGAAWTFERRKLLCGNANDTSLALPVVWFDACFNAFHYKAVADILPYDTQYDKKNWCFSQIVVFTLVELKFRGQALQYVPVSVKNPKHRPYPRQEPDGRFNEVMPPCIEKAEQDAPTVYQNRSLFKEFKAKLNHHFDTSSTYCMKVIPHLPILPYAHFNRTESVG